MAFPWGSVSLRLRCRQQLDCLRNTDQLKACILITRPWHLPARRSDRVSTNSGRTGSHRARGGRARTTAVIVPSPKRRYDGRRVRRAPRCRRRLDCGGWGEGNAGGGDGSSGRV